MCVPSGKTRVNPDASRSTFAAYHRSRHVIEAGATSATEASAGAEAATDGAGDDDDRDDEGDGDDDAGVRDAAIGSGAAAHAIARDGARIAGRRIVEAFDARAINATA